MNQLLHAAAVIFIVSASPFLHAAQKSFSLPKHPSKITYDSLDWEIPLGVPYRTELKNGIVAYIAEDHQLPLVKASVYIRYGSLADPEGKEGLASLLAKMLRAGGTKKFPADTLNELIDLLALRLNFNASETQFTFTASFLGEYTENAFTIMKEMFFHPVFEKKKLEKERKIMLERIRHRFDNPSPTLSSAYDKLMYSRQPSSRLSTEKSVRSITRKDLFRQHKAVFSSNSVIFTIAGAFNSDSMKKRLEDLFAADSATRQGTPFPKVSVHRTTGCLLVHKKISQAYVRLGLPLFQRPHPDYYPISILNFILGGGGFTSRLGKTVRSDAGLTYSIYSSAPSNYTYPSTFFINFFTKNETFARAVTLSLSETRKLVENGSSDQELENAKATLIGELPSMFRTPYDIVSTYGWNEYYHRAPDHFRVYPEKISAITRDDIARVAKQYCTVDSMTVTVVGDTTALINLESGGFSLKNRARTTITPEKIPFLP